VDTNGDEYLQYCKERQTKTRQGDNIGNIRKSGPIAMENKSDRTRCPVLAYKLFSLKRHENMKTTDSPFYIQATIFQDDNIKSKTFWYKNLRLGVGYRMGNQSFSCFHVFSGKTVYMPRQGILFCQICFPLQ
jgi:hypothetical protein